MSVIIQEAIVEDLLLILEETNISKNYYNTV